MATMIEVIESFAGWLARGFGCAPALITIPCGKGSVMPDRVGPLAGGTFRAMSPRRSFADGGACRCSAVDAFALPCSLKGRHL